MSFLPLNEPILGAIERDAVMAAIDSGFVSTAGPIVREFEETMAATLDVGHAVATSSGTAALHLAMVVAGVEAGDLVAVSDLTFIASANAISYCGADLLLVGPDLNSWNMDTELLYDDIKRRARAGQRLPKIIQVVQILGHPARWEPLEALSTEFGIATIEDSSEALGARVLFGDQWQPCGTMGLAGCLSFNGNKMITAGAGGMVLTNNSAVAERVRHLSTQAKLPGLGYQHDAVGFNYRMPALSAALGLAQLTRLGDFLAEKRRIRSDYEALTASSKHIQLAPVAPWADPSHWLISASLTCSETERDRVVAACNDADIGVRPIWRPLHMQAPYAHCERLGVHASVRLHTDGISLPSTPGLRGSDIERVVDVLEKQLAAV